MRSRDVVMGARDSVRGYGTVGRVVLTVTHCFSLGSGMGEGIAMKVACIDGMCGE